MIVTKIKELKQTMMRKGFTGAGLARVSGISQGYIVQVLAGSRNVLPPTAKKICDALECSFDDIFTADVDE